MINKLFKVQDPILHEIIEWIEVIVVAFFLVFFIIRPFIVETTEVEGPSMQPTLMDEDRLIINKFIYNFSEPKRGDVVVFEYNTEANFIKRIIGIPGDVIDIKDGKVIRNGEVLNEEYISDEIIKYGDVKFPVTVTEGHYFVMGDNRNVSFDSRYKSVGENGLVTKSAMRGPVFLRIWPLNKMGIIK